jgi:hypothetical protein
MKVAGFFRDWDIDRYTATRTNEDGTNFSLWICNGFSCFEDHRSGAPFLVAFTLLERWQLWRELKRERRQRVISWLTREERA